MILETEISVPGLSSCFQVQNCAQVRTHIIAFMYIHFIFSRFAVESGHFENSVVKECICEIAKIFLRTSYKRKVKLYLSQAIEVHRLVRRRGSHIF
jgi:hypothetical protein